MGKILDEVTENNVVHIVKRTPTKSNVVILSEQSYTKLTNALNELNEFHLMLAEAQFEIEDFESFVICEDGSRNYSN